MRAYADASGITKDTFDPDRTTDGVRMRLRQMIVSWAEILWSGPANRIDASRQVTAGAIWLAHRLRTFALR